MFNGTKSTADPVLVVMGRSRREKFELLLEGLMGDLYRYAYWVCRDRVQAEELVQETYLRAWKAIGSLRDANSAKSWLFTIFRREYARQFERKRLEMQDVEDMGELSGAKPAFDTSTEAFVLRRALATLSDDYREPLVLQVLGGFNCEEIADVLEISSSAVMTRLFRARKQLRELLTDDESDAQRVTGVRA